MRQTRSEKAVEIQQKRDRLQRVNDSLVMIIWGQFAWAVLCGFIGKLAVAVHDQQSAVPWTSAHAFVIIALFALGGLWPAVGVMHSKRQRLRWEKQVLTAELDAYDKQRRRKKSGVRNVA
jgi:hypothetical protein